MKQSHIYIIIFAAAAVLLFVNLGGRDYWSDEIFSLPKMNDPKVVLAQSSMDVHPPLFFLSEFYWIQLFGRSEAAARSLPALFGLLTITLSFLIARKILPGNRVALYLALLATSPFFLFYSRMAGYYSLTGFLALLSLFFFLQLCIKMKPGAHIGFWLSVLLLIYTDYVGFLYVFCLSVYYFWENRNSPRRLLIYAVWGIAVLLLYLPWISNLMQGASAGTSPYPVENEPGMRDFRLIGSIIYNAIQSAVRLFYTIYNFTLGETVFPWNPIVFIGAGGAFLLFINSLKSGKGNKSFWLFVLILPFVLYLIAVIFYSKVFSASNFALLPSKMFFLQPLWLLFLFKGRSGQKIVYLGAGLLLIFNLCALTNYYRGTQFLNPKFIVPWRAIVSNIESSYKPGDLVVTDESPLLHYLKDTRVRCYGLVGALDYIAEQPKPMEVTLLLRHRGEASIYLEGVKFREAMKEKYRAPEFQGFVPITGLQKRVWSYILKNEFDYYVLLYKYNIKN